MNRKIILALPIALGGLALGAGGSYAANLVQNGGFETSTNTVSTLLPNPDTSVTGWTNNGTFVLYCTAGAGTTCDSQPSLGGFQLAGPGNGHNNGLTSSPQGGSYMAFDSDPEFAGAFSQTIAGLTVGDTYTLSFYAGGAQEIFGGAPPTTRTITAELGDETFTTPVIDTPGQGFSPWQLFSTTFTYTGGGNVLEFLANGGPGGAPPYALLDGVSLTSTTGGTPEPSTWVMIIAGFAGLGLVARSRRKSKAIHA
jgi:hypothetical protein